MPVPFNALKNSGPTLYPRLYKPIHNLMFFVFFKAIQKQLKLTVPEALRQPWKLFLITCILILQVPMQG